MKKRLVIIFFACSTLLVGAIMSTPDALAETDTASNSSKVLLKDVMIPEITKYILGDDVIQGKGEPNVEIILFTWDGIPVTMPVQTDSEGSFETTLLKSYYNGQALKVLDVTNSNYSGLFFPTSRVSLFK